MNKNNYFRIAIIFFIALTAIAMPTAYATENYQSSISKEELDSIINELLQLVNNERAKYNLNPLTFDSDLVSAAAIRSMEIITKFAHERPDGSEITTISSKIQGENIASGQPTAKQLMFEWMNSTVHRENILNPNFTSIGIGYTRYDNDPATQYHTHYWVQLFGGLKDTPKVNKTTIITLKQVGKLAISSISSNKLTLKWNSQSSANANGYQIFRYNSKTKSYLLIKTIKDNKINTYTNTGLTSATKYSYKVRSYLKFDGKTYYGNYSYVAKKATKPSTTSVKVTSGKKKATVSWKKVSKANGYQIYKATSKNGKYYLKKTIKSGSTLKYTDKNLKKRKYYYYKVRSYSIIDKTKVYSAYTSPKAVKAK